MRGVRFNFLDCQLHADAIHRGGGQIIPTAKKALFAACLRAEPRLQEPVYLVEIQGPQSCVGGVYSCLNTRRGLVINEEFVPGSTRKIIRAYLPVAESFKFSEHLRGMTGGEAFPQCVFDHWEAQQSDPLDPTTKAGKIVAEIRKRKNLKEAFPKPEDYEDKL